MHRPASEPAMIGIALRATTFSILGIGAGFWALIAALVASPVAERDGLFAQLQGAQAA
jgi:predicted benzoate:H+ symporter BenE